MPPSIISWGSFAYVVAGYLSFVVVGMVQRQRKAILSPRTFPFPSFIMSALTPQKSTTLGDYGFALNPPPPQGSQHNRGISFGSSPPMRSNEWTHQVYDLRLLPFTFHIMSLVHRQGPNNYSSPASSQPAVTSTSVMRDVIPMTANS